MHRLALPLLLVLCLPLAAQQTKPTAEMKPSSAPHADLATRRVKAGQLVLLLHSDRMVQQAFEGIVKQVSTAAESVTGLNPTPENKARLDDFDSKITQMLDAQLGWKAIDPILTDLYATSFTEQQLDAIIAFYKTPAGAALVEKIPEIDAQVSQLAKSRLNDLQPQMNQMFSDFRKSQLAATPAAPASSSAPAAAAPAPAAAAPAPAAAAPAPAAATPAPAAAAPAPAAAAPAPAVSSPQ